MSEENATDLTAGLNPDEPIFVRPDPAPPADIADTLPESVTGSLVVLVDSIYNTLADDLAQGLPSGPTAINRSVEVTIELVNPQVPGASFADSKFTRDGKVTWSGIPQGSYQIEVSVPEGYGFSGYVTEPGQFSQSSQPFTVTVTDTVTATAYLYAELSALIVTGFWDQNLTGEVTGQSLLDTVNASFKWQGQTLPSSPYLPENNSSSILGPDLYNLLQAEIKQAAANKKATPSIYLFLHEGLVNIYTSSSVQIGLARLRPENPTLMAPLRRGELSQAFIPYVESLNQIEVCSDVVANAASSPFTNGSKGISSARLPSVVYLLYRGTQQGDPFRQGASNGGVPHIFTDLPDGNYTVVASTWPATYAGFGQIQPLDPPAGVFPPLYVSGGKSVRLQFVFSPAMGKVTGLVTRGPGGYGVCDVTISLSPSGGQSITGYQVRTNHLGEYEFVNITPGSYVVSIQEEKVSLPGGKFLEVPAAVQAGVPITVVAAASISVQAFALQEETHKIFGTATAPDGSVLPYLRVEIQNQQGKLIVATQTDQNGYYEALLPQAGAYLVVPKVNSGLQIPAQVNSEVQINITTTASSSVGVGGGASNAAAARRNAEYIEAEIDSQAYPVLTEEVTTSDMGGPRSSSSGGGGSSIAGIGKLAENAIRDVLSWRAKVNDPKSFMLALNQSFALKDVEGHTEFTWTPRTYTVQTDMGAITGAQASIYNRAKVALDQSLPLLDGLYSLVPTLGQEDLDSVRDLVKSLFTELVNDFGIEGGPRIPRVDQLFALLLGTPIPINTEAAGGQLVELRKRFNLDRQYITTIADEQNLTNYMVVVDYVIGLNNSWNAQKQYFARSGAAGAEPFFGTQLVLLSRSLDVVAQSVKDVYFAMDSVFLGASERQTILLDFTSIGGESSMFVAELLDWIDRAASEELPRQLQDSGKDAIGPMQQVIGTLHRFVRTSLIPPQPPKGLPPGYRTPRVQRALRELAQQLNETLRLAGQVKVPDFAPDEGF